MTVQRTMKIIDLSKTIQYNPGDPFFMKVKIKHKPHRKSRWLIRAFGLPFRLFPKKFSGWADDEIKKNIKEFNKVNCERMNIYVDENRINQKNHHLAYQLSIKTLLVLFKNTRIVQVKM